MESSNPWINARATPHHAAVGGLRAFVERNHLETDAPMLGDATSSSMDLIRSLRVLLAKKPQVLAVRSFLVELHVGCGSLTRPSTCGQLTRELETLERHVASAGCLLPHPIRLRLKSATALRTQLQELLALKPALLHALRRSIAAEAVDVELEYQRYEWVWEIAYFQSVLVVDWVFTPGDSSFIALFLKLGDDLPRHTHALAPLDGLAIVAADLAARQHEFERVVRDLATTIADYHALCTEITTLRAVYSHLQSDSHMR